MDTDHKEKGNKRGESSSSCSSGTSALKGEQKKACRYGRSILPRRPLHWGRVESSPVSNDEPTAPGEEPLQQESRRRRNRRRNIRRHHEAGERDPVQPVSRDEISRWEKLQKNGSSGKEGILDDVVGAKATTPPFARGLRRTRCANSDKTTDRLTLRLIRRRTKTCDEVGSSCDLVQIGGPPTIRPIVAGPAWPLRVTGLICKGLPIITVCNPALWEYSGDNLGV
jgi:hypothetical protein